jgi:hypothetical protein
MRTPKPLPASPYLTRTVADAGSNGDAQAVVADVVLPLRDAFGEGALALVFAFKEVAEIFPDVFGSLVDDVARVADPQ